MFVPKAPEVQLTCSTMREMIYKNRDHKARLHASVSVQPRVSEVCSVLRAAFEELFGQREPVVRARGVYRPATFNYVRPLRVFTSHSRSVHACLILYRKALAAATRMGDFETV
ncbi:hypothetical protein EVAR_75594_1 [Eumeta japonica]|uniref:Uncharacterized protein n=1 Tax=Eumeta variegata TaxID=151549 RepID=A0A4C1TZY1_EUMVA|nr:hypothetical protein EVAR_75594_1 [Eumeta japonica]